MHRGALLAAMIAAEAAIGSGFHAAFGPRPSTAIGSGFHAAFGPRPSTPMASRRLCARTQRRWECAAQADSAVLADVKEAGASGRASAIDIVVLGGGPVGLATCVGLLGIDATRKVTVVERGPRNLAKDGPFSNMIGLGARCVSIQGAASGGPLGKGRGEE